MKKVFNIKLVLNFTDEESKEISDEEFCKALHSGFIDEMPFLGEENCIIEPVDKDEIISSLEKEQIAEMQEHQEAMKLADEKIQELKTIIAEMGRGKRAGKTIIKKLLLFDVLEQHTKNLEYQLKNQTTVICTEIKQKLAEKRYKANVQNNDFEVSYLETIVKWHDIVPIISQTQKKFKEAKNDT